MAQKVSSKPDESNSKNVLNPQRNSTSMIVVKLGFQKFFKII
jgi:hypothetical protein